MANSWYKSGLSSETFVRALSSRGDRWVTLTELTGILWDCITPEAAVRAFMSKATQETIDKTPLPEQIARGKKTIVAKRSGAMRYHRMIEKRRARRGSEPSFRIAGVINEEETGTDRQD